MEEHGAGLVGGCKRSREIEQQEPIEGGVVHGPARKRFRKYSPQEIRQVVVFQRFRTYKLAMDAAKFGMTSATAQAIPFVELSTRLRDTALIKTMKLVLHRVCVLTAEGVRCCPGSEQTKNVNVRVFLASFMIAYRASDVFERIDMRLHVAAVEMLKVFDGLCLAICSDLPGKDIAVAVKAALKFPGVLHEYLKAFQAWKVPDEAKLTGRIKHALTALYQAEDHLAEGNADTPRLRAEFRLQQTRLRHKLVQIAGEDALKILDEERTSGGFAVASLAGTRSLANTSSRASTSGYSALPRRMTNEQLAHELLLDPAFTLDEHGGCHGENPVHSKIRASFHLSFWRSLADDLRLDPPDYTRVLRVLGEIRDGIKDLATGGGGWRAAAGISDVIDVELITQQVNAGGFDWPSCVKLIHDVVSILAQFKGISSINGGLVVTPKLPPGVLVSKAPAPPARKAGSSWDEVEGMLETAKVDTVKKPEAFCNALEFLLDRVKAVRIEVANSRLRLIAPVIRDHGVEYERAHMDKKLNTGDVSTLFTRRLIRKVIAELVSSRKLNPLDLTIRDAGKSAAYNTVFVTCVLTMVTGDYPPLIDLFPETLRLDYTRLATMHATFRLSVLTASLLVLVGQTLKDERAPNTYVILDGIAKVIIESTPRAGDLSTVVAAVAAYLRTCSQICDKTCWSLSHVLLKSAKWNAPVPKMMEKRLRHFMALSLEGDAQDVFTDAATINGAFAEVLLPTEVRALIPFLRSMVVKLRKVITVNCSVHAPIYNSIIAGESVALTPIRVRLADDEPPPVGFRYMTVLEAKPRLAEMVKEEVYRIDALSVRLSGGCIELSVDGEWVVTNNDIKGPAPTLIVAISVDKIALKPGDPPPEGYRLLTIAEAESPRWAAALLEGWMHAWSIVRVKNGKIDGIGYSGRTTRGDFTNAAYIGEAFVVCTASTRSRCGFL